MDDASNSARTGFSKPAAARNRICLSQTTITLGLTALAFLAGFGVALWTFGQWRLPFQAPEINFTGAEERNTGLLLALTLFLFIMFMRSRHIVRRLAASE